MSLFRGWWIQRKPDEKACYSSQTQSPFSWWAGLHIVHTIGWDITVKGYWAFSISCGRIELISQCGEAEVGCSKEPSWLLFSNQNTKGSPQGHDIRKGHSDLAQLPDGNNFFLVYYLTLMLTMFFLKIILLVYRILPPFNEALSLQYHWQAHCGCLIESMPKVKPPLVWILNITNKFTNKCGRLSAQLMVLLGGGSSFPRWGLVEDMFRNIPDEGIPVPSVS